jgi:polyphenol oxidase
LGEPVEVIRAEALAGVPHGFLGRRGGVSQGAIAGLNIGHGAEDDAEAVAENRRRAVEAVLPGARLATVYQVHSPDVVEVREPWPHDERPRADAMVSDRPGLLLGIVTADCAPVLLADREAGVIGAAHAGWRGAFAGVLENTVAAMERLGARAERIVAAIGPTIAQPSYEVDAALHDRLVDHDAANIDLLEPGASGHYQFDLPGYVERRLRCYGSGVEIVEDLGLDTYPDENRFFSYRRSTHRGEPTYGRQFSLIGLPG